MKTSSFFTMLIIFFIFIACSDKKISTTLDATSTGRVNDPVQGNLPKMETKANVLKKDTIVGDFKIEYTIAETDDKIYFFQYDASGKGEKTYLLDKSVEVSVTKNGRIFFNRRLSKVDFKQYIPSEYTSYEFSVFDIEEVTADNVIFFINICKPDSDLCYGFNMVINNDGFKVNELEEEEY